jgi:hypothetical protein
MQWPIPFVLLVCTCHVVAHAVATAGVDDAVKTPLHPDDWAILKRIAKHQRLDAPPEVQPKGWPLKAGEKGVRFVASTNPRHALTAVYDQQGRVTKLLGNGPLLDNDALTWAAGLPELRVIRIDHNTPAPGSTTPPENYDGSGFAAFAALKGCKLEQVRIGHAFNDRGMATLAGIASLRSVDICHSQATDVGVAQFAKHPNLEEFSISSQGRPKRITDQAVSSLATIPKLKRLALEETFLTYEGGLKHLAPLKGQLQALSLKWSLVLPADLEQLRRDHPNLIVETSTPTEILEHPNSRGVMKWASPAAVEYLKAAAKK